jgi:hypothetical protein
MMMMIMATMTTTTMMVIIITIAITTTTTKERGFHEQGKYITHDGDIEFKPVTNKIRYSILGLYASSLFTFTNAKQHSVALYI